MQALGVLGVELGPEASSYRHETVPRHKDLDEILLPGPPNPGQSLTQSIFQITTQKGRSKKSHRHIVGPGGVRGRVKEMLRV